jgi:epoxyqueuosine reductase QueG
LETTTSRDRIQERFAELCAEAGRCGVIGFTPVDGVTLLPEQEQYLRQKLAGLGQLADITAVCLGLFYREPEILAVPADWTARPEPDDRWNEYARAYGELNRTLNRVSATLGAEFGGVAEQATMAGWAGQVQHVQDYFSHCVSHRAFAEAAGLGWRGRHGLIVTPECGPALRFATVFLRGRTPRTARDLRGCSDCRACTQVCPVLSAGGEYRETCRRRLHTLGLEDEVCGICVRVCWDRFQTSEVWQAAL